MSHSLQVLCANAENVECFIYRKDKALFLQTCGLNVICNCNVQFFNFNETYRSTYCCLNHVFKNIWFSFWFGWSMKYLCLVFLLLFYETQQFVQVLSTLYPVMQMGIFFMIDGMYQNYNVISGIYMLSTSHNSPFETVYVP